MSAETMIDAGGVWTIEDGGLWNRANDYDLGREDLLSVEDDIYMWLRAVGAKTWTSHAAFMAAWLRACNHYRLTIDAETLARTVEYIWGGRNGA